MTTGKTAKTSKKSSATKGNKGRGNLAVIDEKKELEDIKKTKEFKMFFIWQSMPSVYFGKTPAYLREIGIHDESAHELLSIKTQKEFAKKFNVREATLSEWKGKIKESGLSDDSKTFFKGLTKNILGAFYHKTLEHADAQRVRLWLEEFENKEPERSIPMPTILGPQFNQFIINLKESYNSDLRKLYEDQIRNQGKEVPDSERLRTDTSNGKGKGSKKGQDSGSRSGPKT